MVSIFSYVYYIYISKLIKNIYLFTSFILFPTFPFKKSNFPGQSEKFSINMIRFHLYEWWARLYSKTSVIMLSDFR